MQRYESEEVFGLINVKELECEFAFISALQRNEPLLLFLLQEAHIFNLEFMCFQQLIFFFFSFIIYTVYIHHNEEAFEKFLWNEVASFDIDKTSQAFN